MKEGERGKREARDTLISCCTCVNLDGHPDSRKGVATFSFSLLYTRFLLHLLPREQGMEGNQYREALADSSIAPELKCLSAFVIPWLLFAIVLLRRHFSWLSLFTFPAWFCMNSPDYSFYAVTLNLERNWVKRSSAMKISCIWLAEQHGICSFFI